MKRFAPQRRLVATLVAGLCLMVGTARAAEPVPGDKRLPQDTLVYFSINNVNDFKAKFGDTQFGKLLKDDSMKEFLGQFEGPLQMISGEVEEKTGVPLKDLLKIPSGEVSFAVSQSEQSPVNIVLMLNYGESEETVKKLIEKATASAEEEGGKASEVEVDGVKIVTLSPKGEEESDSKEDASDDDAGGADLQKSFKGVSYAMKDSTLIVSNQAGAIKGVLEKWDGASDSSLANASSYKTIMSKCAPKGEDRAEIAWFVDPMGITKSVISLGAGENPQLGMVMGFLPVLGLDQLKGFGGAMNVGEGDFDNVTRSFINVEQPPRGAMRMFTMPAVEQSPAKWVHDKSSMFLSLNWDLQETYKAIDSLYNTFAGEGALAKMVEDLAENEEGPKIHIKKDIVDQISGLITVAGDVKEEEGDSQERYVVALELTDEAAFKKVLAKAAKFPGFPGSSREFEGHTIYEFSAGAGEEEDESEDSDKQSFRKLADEESEDDKGEGEDEEMEGPDMTPAIAIGRKHLFIGTDVEQLESILRGKDEDSLAESDLFKKVSKYFPSKVSSMSFQRADAQVKAAIEALKSGQLDALIGDSVDLSKLPDFEDVKKYFTPSGGYVRPDDDGVFMENFNLKGD